MSMIREERKWQKFKYENEASDLKISEDFHFQEDGIDTLFPIPCTKYNWILYVKQNEHLKKSFEKWKEEGKWAKNLGTQKNYMAVSCLGFHFTFYIRLGAGEA